MKAHEMEVICHAFVMGLPANGMRKTTLTFGFELQGPRIQDASPMKLRKLTTAAGILALVLLDASCSKAPTEKQASKPPAKEAGPPESAIRDYPQENDLKGTFVNSLELDSTAQSASVFYVQFKIESVAKEDLVLPLFSSDVLKSRGLPWHSMNDTPHFHRVTEPKGTKFTNYGKLLAERQIDRWKITMIGIDGKRPGMPVSALTEPSLAVDSPEAKAYFDRVTEETNDPIGVPPALPGRLSKFDL